jgi:transposase
MVVVGADVHKRTDTFVAVDQVGKEIGQLKVEATSTGHAKALKWARSRFDGELTWVIEDCRHLSARVERDLLTAGQKVVRVPPKMMAQVRASARTRGKSDPIDALAVARAVLREPDLPVASHDAVSREAKLLVDRRDTLVHTRTRTINSLLWRVHELDPERAPKPRSLDLPKHQQGLRTWLLTVDGLVAEMALDELDDIIALTVRIKAFTKRIGALVRRDVPELLALPGCGELSAAKLLGESAGITRFAHEAQFARHGGLAPIPVWSGRTEGRVRMTRSGNRQINCAIHRIAVTQLGMTDSLGRAYYDKSSPRT